MMNHQAKWYHLNSSMLKLLLINLSSSWANALLPHHPEYCKLQHYELLNASAQWDLRFESTDSYDSALAKGYLDPTHFVLGLGFPLDKFVATGTTDYDPLCFDWSLWYFPK